MGWGSSTRRGGGRKVRALPRKFVLLGFRREESGMSRTLLPGYPGPCRCSESLCPNKNKFVRNVRPLEQGCLTFVTMQAMKRRSESDEGSTLSFLLQNPRTQKGFEVFLKLCFSGFLKGTRRVLVPVSRRGLQNAFKTPVGVSNGGAS